MKRRLFLAIDPDSAARKEILSLQQKLEKLQLPINWEPAEKIHLTLNFLGTIPEEEIGTIRKRVSSVVASFPKFSLVPYFLETLYNRHEPSIVYLAPQGDVEMLKNLQKDLRFVLNEMRYPQANRFLPHITIGKFKKADPVAIKSYLDKIHEFPFSPLPSFLVDHITIYESILSRQGSAYQAVDKLVIK